VTADAGRSGDGVVLTIHGARGSTPVSGAPFLRYGGSTIAMSVQTGPSRYLILDCGTGIVALGDGLDSAGGCEFDVLLTHYHWDHIQGLPFFAPLYDPASSFTFHGSPWNDLDLEALIAGTFGPPWFPVALAETKAAKRYVELSGESIAVGPLRVRWARLHHPQGVTAYRIDGPNASVVVATDHEAGVTADTDRALTILARGADVLIHDAQYTDGEYELHHEGWGHSTWRQAVSAASVAGVGRLVLISHDPGRTDEGVDSIVGQARIEFPGTEAAYEGMAISL
jgi:phosphoribosyl 1,2-cyclic phosphodiesterase